MDDFINSEFAKINKNKPPGADGVDNGESTDVPLGGGNPGGYASGVNSNFESSPNVQASNTGSTGTKKPTMAFKPFDMKKKIGGVTSSSKPTFQMGGGSAAVHNNLLNVDESSNNVEDSSNQFAPTGANKIQSSAIKLGGNPSFASGG
jgi:hypothetical protein